MMAIEDQIKLEKYGLDENAPEETKALVLGPKPVRNYTAIENAYRFAKDNNDEKLTKYIVMYEAARDYYSKKKDWIETMTFYKIDRNTFKYACKVFNSGEIYNMIERKVKNHLTANLTMRVNNQEIKNTNNTFTKSTPYGQKLMELIAKICTNANMNVVFLKTIQEEWRRLYPDEPVPCKSTCYIYASRRLKMSYKLRKFRPEARNIVR